jgi:hypothetical protein
METKEPPTLSQRPVAESHTEVFVCHRYTEAESAILTFSQHWSDALADWPDTLAQPGGKRYQHLVLSHRLNID